MPSGSELSEVSENEPSRNCPKSPHGLRTEASQVHETSKKPNLGAPGTKNVGFSGYSRPFSDSFSR